MKARIVPVRELSDADIDAWQDLGRRAVEPNPLFEPSCVIAAARHQSFGDEIALAVTEEDNEFRACFPVREVRRLGKVPYPTVTTQVRRMSYLGTPLVDATRGDQATTALISALMRRHRFGRGRLLALNWLGDDGPVAGYIRSAAADLGLLVGTWEDFERGILRRQPDATYERTRRRNLRHDLNRRRRRFAEEFGSELSITDRAGEPNAIDDYITLEAAGYKADSGVAMMSVEGESEYFRAMCQSFAAEGRLMLPTLEGNGRTLAMEVWLRAGEGLFMIKSSFDEGYARFAPGKQLHVMAMTYFHEHTDAAWIDTCTVANNDLLLRLYPDRRRITTLLIPLSRSPVDAAAVRILTVARPIYRRLRPAGARAISRIAPFPAGG